MGSTVSTIENCENVLLQFATSYFTPPCAFFIRSEQVEAAKKSLSSLKTYTFELSRPHKKFDGIFEFNINWASTVDCVDAGLNLLSTTDL